MRKYLLLTLFVCPVLVIAQDSTMNDLMKNMGSETPSKEPVSVFSGERTINANTTEMTGKGKMSFRVTHNFDDIDGRGGIFGRFLGLDNARDVRIGFHIGLSDRLDVQVSRTRGASFVSKLYGLGLKYLVAQQYENDPSHPLSIAVYVNASVSSVKASANPNQEHGYRSFSDRMSEVVQLIVARKFGKVSLQVNPTYVNTAHTIPNDDPGMFAIGGAGRFPVSKNFSIILDYFHSFRSQASKDFYKTMGVTFYDPIGVSFEITTAGHIFNLNFTNSTDIIENRFIPYTTSSWTKGKFRWGFTVARKFSLWREKNK